MVDIKEAERFFLEAAARTYAADAPKSTIPELPGSKVFHYHRDDFHYLDCYFSQGARSFGQTIIWAKEVPVWEMQYRGDCYDKKAIHLLKEVLRLTYAKGLFIGGRGPKYYRNGSLEYINDVNLAICDFGLFEGREKIIEGINVLFQHDYSGMAFIA